MSSPPAASSVCFGFLATHHSETQSKMTSEVTCLACLEAMHGLWIVCDRCHLRRGARDAQAFAFTRKHISHNFTGLRIVKVGNPCPNRARTYADA